MRSEPGNERPRGDTPGAGPADLDSHVVPPLYLTAAISGVGGRTRERPEDFLVEEIPLYEPRGSGEHIYLFVEKRGMSTMHLSRLLAAHFGVRHSAVGCAGLKDKHAVTRQLMSVHTPGRKPADFPAIRHESVTVLWADLHTNKLRRGHLRGNRFSIRIRGVEPSRVVDAHAALRVLAREGAPNRVGEQRFGARANNHLVGLALAQGRAERVLDLLLAPDPTQRGMMVEARGLYAQGRFQEAIAATPRSARTERVVLGVLARGGGARDAVGAIDEAERGFYINAFQSAVFNAVLDARLRVGTMTTLREGDLAFKHANGAVFAVDAPTAADDATRERLLALEISASGPMWGPEMPRASGAVDTEEVEALRVAGLATGELPELERWGGSAAAGARRPLRIPVLDPDAEAGVDEHGPYIRCAFELPKGSFATSILQEIMKPTAPESIAPGEGEGDDDGR